MANSGILELRLLDTRSAPVEDPSVRVSIRRHDGRLLLRRTLALAPAVRLELPAFPDAHALHGLLEPTRFRAREIPFLSLTHGETVRRDLTVFRRPEEWRARFDAWADLAGGDLAAVLERSPGIRVKGWKVYPELTGAAWDAFGGEREEVPKAALLNVYTRLSTTTAPTTRRSWFSFVRQLLELGRERVIAVVDEEMGTIVQRIRADIASFPDYRRASAGLHHENFPSGYPVAKSRMFSVKTRHEKGNLQLTLAPSVDPSGRETLLLDADIDENGRWLAHALDVFKHRFTGGTHPFDIHEALALETASWPLGYRLARPGSS